MIGVKLEIPQEYVVMKKMKIKEKKLGIYENMVQFCPFKSPWL